MTIRLATPADKDQVLALLREFGDFAKSHNANLADTSAVFDEVISRNDTLIFVADQDGQLIGITTFYLIPNIRHGWKRGHIEDFFVSSSAQHKGVGSQLFNAIKQYCRDHDIKVIKLDSGNELTPAHQFYEKHGGRTSERFFRFDIQ